MFSFRGDAHKIFLHLKKTFQQNQPYSNIKELAEVKEIQRLYESIDSSTLKLINYRMIKEKNGSGIIPIFVTAVPWFLFLFSKQLQHILFEEGSSHWLIIFVIVYFVTLTLSVVLHFREKAWAAFHLEIIQDILEERK